MGVTRKDKDLEKMKALAKEGAENLSTFAHCVDQAEAIKRLLRSHAAQQAQLKRTLVDLRGAKAANAKMFELIEARRFKNAAALQSVEVIRNGK